MAKTTRVVLTLIIVLVIIAAGTALYLRSRHDDKTGTVTPAPSASSSVAASASPAPTVAGVPQCHTGDLSGVVVPDNSAAGTTYDQIVFTNTSSHTCTIYGYPGVSLTDQDGQQLGKPAARGGGASVMLVSVAAGHKAQAAVGFPVAGNFESGTCSAKSTSLQVYPPDETTALVIPFVAQYCPGFSVAAVQPAS